LEKDLKWGKTSEKENLYLLIRDLEEGSG